MKINRFLLPVVFLLLTSCTEKPSAPESPQKAQSSGEIVNKYVDTLTTAKDKAKTAAGAVDTRTEEGNKTAQDMDKQ